MYLFIAIALMALPAVLLLTCFVFNVLAFIERAQQQHSSRYNITLEFIYISPREFKVVTMRPNEEPVTTIVLTVPSGCIPQCKRRGYEKTCGN